MGWDVIYNWFAAPASRAYQYTFAKIGATFRKLCFVRRKDWKSRQVNKKLRERRRANNLLTAFSDSKIDSNAIMECILQINQIISSRLFPSCLSFRLETKCKFESKRWGRKVCGAKPFRSDSFNLSRVIKFTSSSAHSYCGFLLNWADEHFMKFPHEPVQSFVVICNVSCRLSNRWQLSHRNRYEATCRLQQHVMPRHDVCNHVKRYHNWVIWSRSRQGSRHIKSFMRAHKSIFLGRHVRESTAEDKNISVLATDAPQLRLFSFAQLSIPCNPFHLFLPLEWPGQRSEWPKSHFHNCCNFLNVQRRRLLIGSLNQQLISAEKLEQAKVNLICLVTIIAIKFFFSSCTRWQHFNAEKGKKWERRTDVEKLFKLTQNPKGIRNNNSALWWWFNHLRSQMRFYHSNGIARDECEGHLKVLVVEIGVVL